MLQWLEITRLQTAGWQIFAAASFFIAQAADLIQATAVVGKDLTLEQGQLAARNCMLNLLANLQDKIGDLNKIKRFVKVLAFVNSADDFYMQPQVVNGGSELIRDLYGEENGLPARSAIASNALPGNIAVEIEVLVELKQKLIK